MAMNVFVPLVDMMGMVADYDEMLGDDGVEPEDETSQDISMANVMDTTLEGVLSEWNHWVAGHPVSGTEEGEIAEFFNYNTSGNARPEAITAVEGLLPAINDALCDVGAEESCWGNLRLLGDQLVVSIE